MLLEGLTPIHAGKGTVVSLRVQQLSVFIAGVVKHPKLHAVCIRIPGGIQTRIAGSGYAAVGLVDETKPGILGSSLCTQRSAAVLGAIVDEDGLKVGQGLCPQ